MVQVYRKWSSYPEPPATSFLAFFMRYPNPFARHVLSVDVLERTIDPHTGQMRTVRLILKRGLVPAWASRWLPAAKASGGRGLDAWILEESIVDAPGWGVPEGRRIPVERRAEIDEYTARALQKAPGEADLGRYLVEPRLRVVQGNLSHKKFMHVVEGAELSTLHCSTAEVRSQFGGSWSSMIRSKIESYGIGKFEGNTETARKGMSLILRLLNRNEFINGSIDADKIAAAEKEQV